MIVSARYTSRNRRIAPIVLMPPNLEDFGSPPFTEDSFADLDAWLAEEGWPPEHMDAAMLEGYLVALLAWPIELSAGAWLPPIWGIRGWKVAAKIATAEAYDRFLVLIISFLQDLERRLTASPRLRTNVLEHRPRIFSVRYSVGSAWATGFMIALREHSSGLGVRTARARSAVEGIAQVASLRFINADAVASVAQNLQAQVAKLMDERLSRLQLGPISVCLSGGARGGQPRHINLGKVSLVPVRQMGRGALRRERVESRHGE
jgi:yecA family protein